LRITHIDPDASLGILRRFGCRFAIVHDEGDEPFAGSSLLEVDFFDHCVVWEFAVITDLYLTDLR
jgi:hypothetical protein